MPMALSSMELPAQSSGQGDYNSNNHVDLESAVRQLLHLDEERRRAALETMATYAADSVQKSAEPTPTGLPAGLSPPPGLKAPAKQEKQAKQLDPSWSPDSKAPFPMMPAKVESSELPASPSFLAGAAELLSPDLASGGDVQVQHAASILQAAIMNWEAATEHLRNGASEPIKPQRRPVAPRVIPKSSPQAKKKGKILESVAEEIDGESTTAEPNSASSGTETPGLKEVHSPKNSPAPPPGLKEVSSPKNSPMLVTPPGLKEVHSPANTQVGAAAAATSSPKHGPAGVPQLTEQTIAKIMHQQMNDQGGAMADSPDGNMNTAWLRKCLEEEQKRSYQKILGLLQAREMNYSAPGYMDGYAAAGWQGMGQDPSMMAYGAMDPMWAMQTQLPAIFCGADSQGWSPDLQAQMLEQAGRPQSNKHGGGGGYEKRGNVAHERITKGSAGLRAAEVLGGWEEQTLRTHLRDLQQGDPKRVFIVRKINRIGFNSPAVLEGHYKQYGPVEAVRVAHSYVKSTSTALPSRLRPSGLGFVVMEKVADAKAILAMGEQQVVAGCVIKVQPFEQRAMDEETSTSNGSDEASDETWASSWSTTTGPVSA